MQIYLAPILGITYAHYRNSFEKYFGGIDKYFAPFVSTVQSEIINPSLLKDLLPCVNLVTPHLIPQILGNNGADFSRMANAITDLGYKEVNWNIGCPVPTVTRKNKGAGILAYHEKIEHFLETAMKDIKCSLSIKMRLGMKSADDYKKVIPVLNKFPLSEVIIHARTGIQVYKGRVDFENFTEALSLSKHKVVYNGDIFSYDDYTDLKKRFPDVGCIMLGRGALSDPFLPRSIKGNDKFNGNRIEMIRVFHDDLYQYYKKLLSGGRHLCDRMKGLWSYFGVHMDTSKSILKKVQRVKNIEEYDITVAEIFNTDLIWRMDRHYPHLL